MPGHHPKNIVSIYELSLLFAGVLANQAGVPLPMVPALLAAGALSAHAGTGVISSILVTALAALVADTIWYGVGRWRGQQALRTVARLLRRSTEHVGTTEWRFRNHQLVLLFGGRFVPELNPIAAGMAGATRMRLRRYGAIAVASALAWAGSWTGAGYALATITREAAVPLVSLATVVVIGAVLAVVLKHRRRRARIAARGDDGHMLSRLPRCLGS